MRNNIFMRFPQGRAKALTLSYDDGVRFDIRLIELMKQYGIKGTFNINGANFGADDKAYRLSEEEIKEVYANIYCEVALHGYTHPHLEALPTAAMLDEVISDRKSLEGVFGNIIRGMAYPYGSYNDKVVEGLRLCNVAYCRTVKSTHTFDMPTEWLTLHPTCHHRDPALQELTQKFLESKFMPPKMFYLWGHSYEFNNDNNWDVIENFFKTVTGNPEIWFATNGEIYYYTKAYEQLEFSADLTFVKNPTLTDIWFVCDKNIIRVNAGETIKF